LHHYGLTKLHLQNFRSHANLSIDCDAQAIIITGNNGAGKTNILEAISMLAVGKGIRGANVQEQLRIEGGDFWRIVANLRLNQGECQITSFYDRLNAAKRVIKIEENILPRQADILQYLSILWLLPTQAHLFHGAMSDRRKYFDRIVYSFDASHSTRINSYEHYVRERGRLLKSGYYDAAWVSSVEAKIAQYAIEVVRIRLRIAEILNETIQSLDDIFPKAELRFNGEVEAILCHENPIIALQELLCQRRNDDMRMGRCSVGAHKSQLQVLWLNNGRDAELCSTGEQKALLLSILMAQIKSLQMQRTATSPPIILLLDEMVAHLDYERRSALFALIQASEIQLFATGTDEAAFDDLSKFNDLSNAKHVRL
jgi:DNA replication and repair protein RecF